MSRNSSRDRKARIDDVLEGARTIINLGKDTLELAPIPGLVVAAGVLSELIGVVIVRLSPHIF